MTSWVKKRERTDVCIGKLRNSTCVLWNTLCELHVFIAFEAYSTITMCCDEPWVSIEEHMEEVKDQLHRDSAFFCTFVYCNSI